MKREINLYASEAETPTRFTGREVRRWNRARHAADRLQTRLSAGDWDARLYEFGRWIFGLAVAVAVFGLPFIFARIAWAFISGQFTAVMSQIEKGVH